MGTLNIGDTIRIPCEVKPGPFSDEKFVSFETVDGIISGFVEANEIQERNSRFFVSGIVKETSGDKIVVVVRGSFFQTNGIATVDRTTACAA